MSHPLVTFMIATHNRVGELVQTLTSCRHQDWPNTEVMVVDDASSDDTFEVVRREFPEVHIVRNEKNQGSIASRNRILADARGDYIVALDDDSRFTETDACRRIVERMEAEPDLGIISFQAIGPEFPERMTERGRLHGEWHCSSFAACGAALRRRMLAETGLLEAYFYHAYEEPDLCLRAWNAGFRVLQWNEIVVYHAFSPANRSEQRTHRRHARNEACSIVMRYPWHLIPQALIARLASQFAYARRRGWGWQEPRVWLELAGRLPQALWRRRPVGTSAVKISLAVNRRQITSPDEVWGYGDAPWREVLHREPSDQSPKATAAPQESTCPV